MYLARFLVFLVVIYLVECRNNLKALTDNLGHEVIEIGTPVKELQELPPGVEEEPSAEMDEETSAAPLATRRETKRVVTTTSITPKPKVVDKEESVSQEEEEARIEQELAEIYKDTDYKSDVAETKKLQTLAANITEEKSIGRSRINFKFQPDVNNRQDIERFRTSIDEISCDRRVTQKLQADKSKSTSTSDYVMSFIEIGAVVVSLLVCY